jgi:hypothetical protein
MLPTSTADVILAIGRGHIALSLLDGTCTSDSISILTAAHRRRAKVALHGPAQHELALRTRF